MKSDIGFSKSVEESGNNTRVFDKAIIEISNTQKELNIFHKSNMDPIFNNFDLFEIHFDSFCINNKL